MSYHEYFERFFYKHAIFYLISFYFYVYTIDEFAFLKD